MHTLLRVEPTPSEINRLMVEEMLDRKKQPVRMTHVVMRELTSDEGYTLALYENVFVSPLPPSKKDTAIIFDRDGRAFECSTRDVKEMEHIPCDATAV